MSSARAKASPVCRHCGNEFETMDDMVSHDCVDEAISRAVMGLIENREEVYPDAKH